MGLNNNVRPGAKIIFTAKNYLTDMELERLVKLHKKLLDDMKRLRIIDSLSDLNEQIDISINLNESVVKSLNKNMEKSKDYVKREYEKWKMSNQGSSHSSASTTKRNSLRKPESTVKRRSSRKLESTVKRKGLRKLESTIKRAKNR